MGRERTCEITGKKGSVSILYLGGGQTKGGKKYMSCSREDREIDRENEKRAGLKDSIQSLGGLSKREREIKSEKKGETDVRAVICPNQPESAQTVAPVRTFLRPADSVVLALGEWEGSRTVQGQ